MNESQKKVIAYVKGRPGYPETAMEYIKSIVKPDSIFAEVGAGTGKFSELIARQNFKLYAIEPDDEMRKMLDVVLCCFKNVEIIKATAEQTGLQDSSIDVVTVAQALHWFDGNKFKEECLRILKPNGVVIVLNNSPGTAEKSMIDDKFHPGHPKMRLEAINGFFKNPVIKHFENPIEYDKEKWLSYMLSHSDSPTKTDGNYEEFLKSTAVFFDRYSNRGILKRKTITTVYHEKMK